MSINVAENYFKHQKNNLNNYLTFIMGEKNNKTINNTLVKAYLEVRYYNYGETYGSFKQTIEHYLKDSTKSLLNSNLDSELIKIYVETLMQLFYLNSFSSPELIKDKINAINNYRLQKLKINDKSFNESFYKTIKIDLNAEVNYFKDFLTDDFNLEINKIKNMNVYDVKIDYHIVFNNLYSKYAIINAFNTGLVNEDKLSVLYYLYAVMAVKNIIKGEFNKNYLLDFDFNLFTKKKKLNSLLNIINSDPIKDFTAIKISYNDFNNYKNEIYDLKRDGFNFALIIDSTYIDDDINFTKLQIFKYVIINNEDYKYDRLITLSNIIMM